MVASSSWRPQGRHLRLFPDAAPQGVDGGPEPVPGLDPGASHDDEGAPSSRLNLPAVCYNKAITARAAAERTMRLRPATGIS
jgi:hypothetical protein